MGPTQTEGFIKHVSAPLRSLPPPTGRLHGGGVHDWPCAHPSSCRDGQRHMASGTPS